MFPFKRAQRKTNSLRCERRIKNNFKKICTFNSRELISESLRRSILHEAVIGTNSSMTVLSSNTTNVSGYFSNVCVCLSCCSWKGHTWNNFVVKVAVHFSSKIHNPSQPQSSCGWWSPVTCLGTNWGHLIPNWSLRQLIPTTPVQVVLRSNPVCFPHVVHMNISSHLTVSFVFMCFSSHHLLLFKGQSDTQWTNQEQQCFLLEKSIFHHISSNFAQWSYGLD